MLYNIKLNDRCKPRTTFISTTGDPKEIKMVDFFLFNILRLLSQRFQLVLHQIARLRK